MGFSKKKPEKDISKSNGSAKPDRTRTTVPRGKREIVCIWCQPHGSGYRLNGGYCTTCSGTGVLWIDEK